MLKVYTIALITVLFLAGCAVPGSGAGTEAPPITVDREAAQQYLDEVRPILDRTARDVARVADISVGPDGVSVDPNSIEQARQETQQGLEELKAVQPPPGLEEAHGRLVTAYEEAVPAFNNLVGALQSGDPIEIARSVKDDVPKIQRLLAEIEAVRQGLQQAGAR